MELQLKRLAICGSCEFKHVLPKVRVAVCKACGCPISNKVKFDRAKCPKAKW